jgi:hypothetical protein
MFGCVGKMGGRNYRQSRAARGPHPPESTAAAFYAIFRLFHLPMQNNFFTNQNNC